MSQGPPIDLRALGDVNSPEVVSEALRRFRSRLLRRYVWIGLLVLLGVAVLLFGRQHRDLRSRIEHARFATLPSGAVWRVKGATVKLRQVTDLGATTGLTFVVIGEPETLKNGKVNPIDPAVQLIPKGGALAVEGEFTPLQYFEIPKSADGILPVATRVSYELCHPHRPCPRVLRDTIAIDFKALRIPPTIWRAS